MALFLKDLRSWGWERRPGKKIIVDLKFSRAKETEYISAGYFPLTCSVRSNLLKLTHFNIKFISLLITSCFFNTLHLHTVQP